MPAGRRVENELHALARGQLPTRLPLSSLFAGRQQLADQVVAGSGPPGLEQPGHVRLGFGDGLLDEDVGIDILGQRPLVAPKNSAILAAGNAVFRDRRKTSPAS